MFARVTLHKHKNILQQLPVRNMLEKGLEMIVGGNLFYCIVNVDILVFCSILSDHISFQNLPRSATYFLSRHECD